MSEQAVGPEQTAVNDEPPELLLVMLKALQLRLAQRHGRAPFMIFPQATLEELARRQPTTVTEAAQVHGFGERRAELYGEDVAACIREYLSEVQP